MNRRVNPCSGILWIRTPGVAALPLTHMLRAVFCFREDVPSAAGQTMAAVPEEWIGPGCVLAGCFGDATALPRRYPILARDPRLFRLTAVAEPAEVEAAVYRHLVEQDPELPARRPRMFGSLEAFLDSRSEPLTTGLGAAFRRRKADVSMFDAIVVEESMEESLRALARLLRERFSPGSREDCLLARACELEESLVTAFGDRTTSDPLPEELRRRYRARNPRDAQFYEAARQRMGRARRPRFSLRRPRAFGGSSDPVFVFNHLPKCYGTSLRVWLQTAFGSLEDHTEFLGTTNPVANRPAAIDTLAADTVLCGHFCDGVYRLPTRYPGAWKEGSRFHFFTFVRDPLGMAMSDYLHVIRHDPKRAAGQPEVYASLETFLLAQNNPLAFRLGCGESDWSCVMERYFFVGVTERLDESLRGLIVGMRRILAAAPLTRSVQRALAALDVLERAPLPHANAGSSPDCEVSDGTLRRFREQNALDYKIYHHALKTLGGASS